MRAEYAPGPSPETQERRGVNVTIRRTFQRHAQKMSGNVFNATGTGTATSSISPAGAERATELGRSMHSTASVVKAYVSDQPRTAETHAATMAGYLETNPVVTEFTSTVRQELIAPGPGNYESVAPGVREWLKEYDARWSAAKSQLTEAHFPGRAFSSLTPDEQQAIAEEAEEPIVREWIDNPSSTLALNFPPRKVAARFAAMFRRTGAQMAERLNEGSDVHLFYQTHKTATEPFLASGVLIRESDGTPVRRLDEIGGSLEILGNWEAETTTDSDGRSTEVVTLRGERFTVDPQTLNELADEGLQDLEITRQAKTGAP